MTLPGKMKLLISVVQMTINLLLFSRKNNTKLIVIESITVHVLKLRFAN